MKIKIMSIVAVLAFVSFAPMALAQCSGHAAAHSEKPDCCGTCQKSAGEKEAGSCGGCPKAGKAACGSSEDCPKAGKAACGSCEGCPKAGKAGCNAEKKGSLAGGDCCGSCGGHPKAGKAACGSGKQAALAGDKDCGSCEGCPHAGKSGSCGAEKHATLAGDEGRGSCGSCPKAGKLAADGKPACPIAAKVETVMESMPSMKYEVNGVQLCCHKTAEKMAEKAHQPVKYAVGDTVYDKQAEAQVKLAALLEKKLESMHKMEYSVGGEHMSCPTTAAKVAQEKHTDVGYCVAGFDFEDQGTAEEVLSQCKSACDGVKMMYKVGGETYSCSKTADAECKATGGNMMYIVGDEEMTCPISANLKLQEKKIRAFVETAAYASAH